MVLSRTVEGGEDIPCGPLTCHGGCDQSFFGCSSSIFRMAAVILGVREDGSDWH